MVNYYNHPGGIFQNLINVKATQTFKYASRSEVFNQQHLLQFMFTL